MKALDTNILVYAHRKELEFHFKALRLLNEIATGREMWALPIFCLIEFLRVATHPNLFSPYGSLDKVWNAVFLLTNSPNFQVIHPSTRYLSILGEISKEAKSVGNDIFDASLLELLVEKRSRSPMINYLEMKKR